MTKKLIGFYDSIFFWESQVPAHSGILVRDEKTGKRLKLSHSTIERKRRKCQN